MRDRNEWFKEVERAYLNIELKTANRPYEIPVEVDVVEGEDVLYALGLHPRLDTPDWLVIDLDEVSELVELIRQVYCPDGGGNLRLTYDLRMQAAKSLREDSTLCLLWSMLMDSYSRWRTTGDVFSEMGENCDL